MEYYTRFAEQCQGVSEQYLKLCGTKGRKFCQKRSKNVLVEVIATL
jgi:hypothetical protein